MVDVISLLLSPCTRKIRNVCLIFILFCVLHFVTCFDILINRITLFLPLGQLLLEKSLIHVLWKGKGKYPGGVVAFRTGWINYKIVQNKQTFSTEGQRRLSHIGSQASSN